jgi:hypothetical protein
MMRSINVTGGIFKYAYVFFRCCSDYVPIAIAFDKLLLKVMDTLSMIDLDLLLLRLKYSTTLALQPSLLSLVYVIVPSLQA